MYAELKENPPVVMLHPVGAVNPHFVWVAAKAPVVQFVGIQYVAFVTLLVMAENETGLLVQVGGVPE